MADYLVRALVLSEDGRVVGAVSVDFQGQLAAQTSAVSANSAYDYVAESVGSGMGATVVVTSITEVAP